MKNEKWEKINKKKYERIKMFIYILILKNKVWKYSSKYKTYKSIYKKKKIHI